MGTKKYEKQWTPQGFVILDEEPQDIVEQRKDPDRRAAVEAHKKRIRKVLERRRSSGRPR